MRLNWSGRKGRATAATLFGMRVVEHESGLNQRVLPVERHSVQIHHALGINKDLHVLKTEDLIRGPGLSIELELIAEPRTSAAQNAQTQTTVDALSLEGG